MKNLPLILIASLSLAIGNPVSAVEKNNDALHRQMEKITARLMPSAKHRKVKIPGLKAQAVKHRNIWQCVSPGFVNVPSHVTVKGDTITMLIDIGGLMQSKDGGKTWKYTSYMLEDGITGRSFFDFDISPVDEKNIVIGANRIYRSLDGGNTWHASFKGLPPLKHNTRANGYGQVKYNCNGKVLFTAIGTKVTMPVGWEKMLSKHFTKKQIWFTRDNGESFQAIKIPRPFSVIKRIYPHPNNPDIVYFSFADGDFFVTHDATASNPTVRKLDCVPKEHFVRDMSINPTNNHEMLLTISACKKTHKNPSYLYKSANCQSSRIQITKVPVKSKNGKAFKCKDLTTVGFNPDKPGQIVLGEKKSPSLYISDDNLKSFYRYSLPKKFFCDGNLGHFYGQIERVFFGKSKYAVIVSKIGSWITSDNFKTVQDLTMKYKADFFSHRGVGTPANINSISISRDNAFFAAQDHGAWISDNNDYMKWKRLTGNNDYVKFPLQPSPWGKDYTWLHQVEKIFSSYDGKFVYINCNAILRKKFRHSFWADKKFFLTRNKGKSWQDISARLGKGKVYPEGSEFLKVLFNSTDSSKHWFLMTNALYYTENGGKNFIQLNSKMFDKIKIKNALMFSDLAYDSGHNILYLSVRTKPTFQHNKLNHATSPAALYRSFDLGKSWEVYNIQQNAIRSIAVTDDGTLAVGTQKTADQPARLIIIPFGKKYDESMVKLTVGDTPEEISANQICVGPVVCDGKDILAYSNNDWFHSDRFFAQGPLLSRDNGKTFNWINHNLPCTNIWSATMKDGKILIGTTFGLMEWKYK
jgi:hypothetical protein